MGLLTSRPSVRVFPNSLEPRIHKFGASARIRGQWVAKYLQKAGWNCDVAKHWEEPGTADVSFFQKAYQHTRALPLAKSLTEAGKAVVFGLCDADWLLQRKQPALTRILSYCTAAVGCSPILTAWLSQYVPSFTIGDGVDMDLHSQTKEHSDKKVLKVVWFGNQNNWRVIEDKIGQVTASGHEMVTISDHPKASKSWSLEMVNRDILECDIFWDPRGFGYEWECKTNNKELKAWALGIPVVHDEHFASCLDRFGTAEQRNKEARYRLKVLERFWSMDVVIKQWEAAFTAAWAMARGK